MKKIFILLFVYAFALTACGQENTLAYENTSVRNHSSVTNTEAKIDIYVSAEDTDKVKEITMKLLNQNNAYLVSKFYFKDRIYWLALEKKTMSEIFFYANRDFTNVKFVNKKNTNYTGASYHYFVKNNLFKH